MLLDAVGVGWDRVEYVTDRKGHDLRYSLDDSKIREHLGYAPQVSFTEGLAATVAWYRAHHSSWEPLKEKAALR